MNGGYIMLDCKSLDLTKGITEQTISGLYHEVEQAVKTGKPIIAYNCIWGNGVPMSPIAVMVTTAGYENTLICTASTLQIIVTSSDVVTINNMAPQG